MEGSDKQHQALEPLPLPQLPEAVLVSILQRVFPLKARLANCTLVCKAWAAAVAATTVDLDAELSSCIRWQHVQDYLDQHAGQVSSMSFSHHGRSRQLLQLPCARLSQLQRLHVDSMTVRLQECQPPAHASLLDAFSSSCSLVSTQGLAQDASTSSAAVAASQPAPLRAQYQLLPSLQQLQLSSCSASLTDLLQLSQATSLTSLTLYDVSITADSTAPAGEEQLTAAMSSVLQGLPNLSVLSIHLMGFSPAALCPVSAMRRLQQLQLYISSTDDDHTNSFLASLPASLTALGLKDLSIRPSPAVAAHLRSLSSLQQLRLEELDLDASVLGGWAGSLQSLVLDAVYLVASARQTVAVVDTTTTTTDSNNSTWQGPAGDDLGQGPQALFGALQQLSQLQHLELSRMQLDEVTDVQQLSALTASPQLTSLHLLARFSMPLPMGALQHLLPPGLQLPLLRVLRLQGGDGVSEQQCLGASDVERVADCCPHLTDLTLKGVLSVGASLEPLLRLRASLQALSVAGAAFGDAAAGCVAKLTGLQALEWSDSVGLTDAGVQQLTGLRQLRRLSVKSCKGLSRAILPPDDWYKASQLVLEAGVQAGAADVCHQLEQLCLAAAQERSHLLGGS